MFIQTPEDAIFAYRAVVTTGGDSAKAAKPLKRVMLRAIEASMTIDGDEEALADIEDYVSIETLVDTIPGSEDVLARQATQEVTLSTLEKFAVIRAVHKYRSMPAQDATTKKQAELFLASHTNSFLGRVASMIVL